MIPALESLELESPVSSGHCPAGDSPSFDRLARAYRWMEWLSFGPFLGLCRSNFLFHLTHCRHALVLGDGDGRFTARLLGENPSIRAHAIDGSPAMLGAMTKTCGPNASRLTTEQADLRTWHPGSCLINVDGPEKSVPQGLKPSSLLAFCGTTEVVPFQNPLLPFCGTTEVVPFQNALDESSSSQLPVYDLVVTHFFLDCLSTDEVLALARRVRPVLSPGALWVVSEFAVPKGWFGRVVAGPTVHGLYLAFGFLTGLRQRKLPDYAPALSAAGFTRMERRPRLGGLLVSELWAAEGRSLEEMPG
jgi:hypothetical protein